jgi:hypothetical protein
MKGDINNRSFLTSSVKTLRNPPQSLSPHSHHLPASHGRLTEDAHSFSFLDEKLAFKHTLSLDNLMILASLLLGGTS